LKLSVVAASIRRRAERSARAHTTPESAETSPDCTPCVIIGLSAQRLNAGAATLPKAAAVAAEAKDVRNRRRVVTLPARGRPDMNLSPPNHRGGWLRFLTVKKSKTTGV
jgi:hypothetical protein